MAGLQSAFSNTNSHSPYIVTARRYPMKPTPTPNAMSTDRTTCAISTDAPTEAASATDATNCAGVNQKISFVHFERRILLDLVQRHRDVVHDRRTDSTSVHRKQQTWLQIAAEYNGHPSIGRRRAVHQLKRLWQNTRARAKQAGVGRVSVLAPPTAAAVAITTSHKTGTRMEPTTLQQQQQHSAAHKGPTGRVYANDCAEADDDCDDEDDEDDEDEEAESAGDFESGADLQNIDRCRNSIAAARLRKLHNSIGHQTEQHRASMYREQLSCQRVQDEMRTAVDQHAQQMQRDRELHKLRIAHELERHAQQMAQDREWHQLRLEQQRQQQAHLHQQIGSGVYPAP